MIQECISITDYLVMLIAIIATLIAYFATRFQGLSLIQSQISDKARECNTNIDTTSHALLEKSQNISHVLSTIITSEQLIIRTKRSMTFFFLNKQSLIDQLYLQLHTSIIEYIIANKITQSLEDGQVKFHLELQLKYCHKLFVKSFKRFGNATPKEINVLLEKYKNKTAANKR